MDCVLSNKEAAASGNPGALAERSASSGLPELNIHPLTAQPGWEFYPALSPDGKSVAFTWTGDLKRARPIYVKRFDSEAPVLLFEPPPNEMVGPLAWSPDGSKLTFKTSNDQLRRHLDNPVKRRRCRETDQSRQRKSDLIH